MSPLREVTPLVRTLFHCRRDSLIRGGTTGSQFYDWCTMLSLNILWLGSSINLSFSEGAVLVVIAWQLDLQVPMQSVLITIKVVSSNIVHGEVYSVQRYWIKFVTGWWFSPGIPVSSTNKSDRHDITEILLKVTLNTINQTKPSKDRGRGGICPYLTTHLRIGVVEEFVLILQWSMINPGVSITFYDIVVLITLYMYIGIDSSIYYLNYFISNNSYTNVDIF